MDRLAIQDIYGGIDDELVAQHYEFPDPPDPPAFRELPELEFKQFVSSAPSDTLQRSLDEATKARADAWQKSQQAQASQLELAKLKEQQNEQEKRRLQNELLYEKLRNPSPLKIYELDLLPNKATIAYLERERLKKEIQEELLKKKRDSNELSQMFNFHHESKPKPKARARSKSPRRNKPKPRARSKSPKKSKSRR